MLENTKKSNLSSCQKVWNKPTINKLQVKKTLSGVGEKNENGGHPLGSPRNSNGNGLGY